MSAIDLETKKTCVELNAQGKNSREIYEEYFSKQHSGMNYQTFRAKLKQWKKRTFADEKTLECGTYAGFTAHNATVQVNANGEITQAWIKQATNDIDFAELCDVIRENANPINIEREIEDCDGMLEIPLYDLHFPLSDHKETLLNVKEIIRAKRRETVYIIIGQDLFHNDDMRGRTSSGRQIEKVDIPAAWRMAWDFYQDVIITSLKNSENVHIVYSKGNHDECLAWAFVQALKERFPRTQVDDSLKARKCIYWQECFIGITHGNNSNSKNNDLRSQFTIEFPWQFAGAKVREIHCGHLHHEREADLFGVMIRRLSRSGVTDEWSDDEGFIGSHNRSMVFEWTTGRLKAIYYV